MAKIYAFLVSLAVLGLSVSAEATTHTFTANLDGVADNVTVQEAFKQAGIDGGDVIIDGLAEINYGSWNHLGNPYRTFGVYIEGNAKTVRIKCINGGGFRAIGEVTGVGSTFKMFAVFYNDKPVFVEGCTFDMSAQTGSGLSEQRHAFEAFYGAHQVHGRDLVFFHPSLGPSTGGDCIRMIGGYTEPELVRDLTFVNTTFLSCDRSDFSFQRSVQGVTIIHFVTLSGDDQNLDQEATGVLDPIVDPQGLTRIRDIRISGATIVRPNGGTAVTMGRGIGMTLRDSSILGGQLSLLSCEDCNLDTLRLIAPCSDRSAIILKRASDIVNMNALNVSRFGGCLGGPDPLIYIVADNDGRPTNVRLTNSVIEQSASNVAVMVRASQAFINNNTIKYVGSLPATANAVAIVFETIYTNIASGSITNNAIEGQWYAVANISPHYHAVNNPTGSVVGPVSVVGNTFDGPKRGVRCINYLTLPHLFRSIVRAANNNAGTPWVDECPIATTGN